jgi:hypothetical protein
MKPNTAAAIRQDVIAPGIDRQVFAGAFAALADMAQPVLITGRAGTGKTTLIHELRKDKSVKQVVVAPTGVAALQAGGQTIHSLFQIPPRLQNLSEIQPIRGRNRMVVKNIQRLIIDEISMVRADLLDKIDHSLKLNRGNRAPFGGVQVVMVGDFYQLPPVTPPAEIEMLAAAGYTTLYAPGAMCLRDVKLAAIELQQVFRQTEPEFIAMLGNIRRGHTLDMTLQKLNSHCVRPHRADCTPLLLTGHNAQADAYNTAKLTALPGSAKKYDGKIDGEFGLDGNQLPAPPLLELKVGARIMMVKNDQQKRWVNGSLATVINATDKEISIRLDGARETYDVGPHTWERYRYSWNAKKNEVDTDVVGTYTQIPAKLAWASTIHKAQGLSLNDVRIDLGRGAFASGQAYVALSRATSLAGLSLAQPLNVADVIVDGRIGEMLSAI